MNFMKDIYLYLCNKGKQTERLFRRESIDSFINKEVNMRIVSLDTPANKATKLHVKYLAYVRKHLLKHD